MPYIAVKPTIPLQASGGLRFQVKAPCHTSPARAGSPSRAAGPLPSTLLALCATDGYARRGSAGEQARTSLGQPQGRRDSSVAPESAQIIYDGISTPADQKRSVWFESSEHETFRDCECEHTIAVFVEYVRERVSGAG